MSQSASFPPLASQGGTPAFTGMKGTAQPKLGVAEFMALAERFGFNEAALTRLRGAVTDADLPAGGPNLARYYSANPKPPVGELYEAEARAYFGVSHALSISSGTAALHAAMVAVGAGPGKEVICPATGFLATAMAVALTGATPVFCDIDDSMQMNPALLPGLITPRTVALVPTHHWGVVADMAPIVALAKERGLKVVEDCAQSPGAHYRGQLVGTIGDIGCFSISAYKIIGGGEGGLLITRDERLWERAAQTAEAGGLWRPKRFAPPRYEGELFPGTNYRFSELEAAVDRVQLRKLPGIVARHRQVAQRILAQVRPVPGISWQKRNDPAGDIGYLLRCYPATHELAAKVTAALRAEGLPASHRGADAPPDWHLHRDMYPLHPQFGAQCRADQCPVAVDLYNRCVMISLNQWYNADDCDAIALGINKVFAALCPTT